MKDFCNVAERDSIRLIIAQDLKENGFDLEANYNQKYQGKSVNKSNISRVDPDHVDGSTNFGNGSAASGRVFCVHLKDLETTQIVLNDQLLNVPVFLKYAVDHLTQFIKIEGIFRRNGQAARIKELRKQIEDGNFNFHNFAPFDITSIIKLFFRELPDSLLTFHLYTHFIQAIKIDDPVKLRFTMLNLCLQLSDANLHTLIYIMQFLKQISQHEADNKMNSYNLAVCFTPNIIYTKQQHKPNANELYVKEEHSVVQFLIDNSSLIGKISDSVYERSLMLTSLCCSADSKDYDGEQESFAQRSTSLSSYSHNNNANFSQINKKEKKKRRSSSLKELMTTIQNSISKFRRRSASEKNDKTSCSIISTMDTSTRCLDNETIKATPYKLTTPICTNLYTPRIKRNAEESIQSTATKNRKLLDKLPQRNLLPNAPITPFSTTKKSKHQFKLVPNDLPKEGKLPLMPNTPIINSNIVSATPLNVVNLQKQLKYEESPSSLFNAAANASINPIYDSTNLGLKMKSHHTTDKNHTISNGEINDCRRRLIDLPLNSENIKHNHHYYHYHQNPHHHHHHHHHQYVNQHNLDRLTYSTSSSFTSGTTTQHSHSTCEYNNNNNTTLNQRNLTDSMRCTLKRGRPNTPKTGLSIEYKNRKSSLNTTPEASHSRPPICQQYNSQSDHGNEANKNIINLDHEALNNALIGDEDDPDKVAIEGIDALNNQIYGTLDDLNDARLDEALIGDEDIDIDCESEVTDGEDNDENKENHNLDEDNVDEANEKNEEVNDVEQIKKEDSFKIDQESINEIVECKKVNFNFTNVDFENITNENMLQNVLRRQSLFKLREKIHGRVSKHVNEIEQRKLSPYRFCNSPLKKSNNLSIAKTQSPVRVPSVFCKNLIKSGIIQEQFKIKRMNKDQRTLAQSTSSTSNSNLNEANLPTDSTLIVKVANEFNKNKKLNRCRSVKRLNRQQPSPLSKSLNGSPVTKLHTTQLNCASETLDF